MKKFKTFRLVACMLLGIIILLSTSACRTSPDPAPAPAPDPTPATDTEPAPPATEDTSNLNIAVVVFGAFGDNGFNDLARMGLERAIDELGISGRAFETGGYDITRIEPLLLDLCESGEFDVIFAMGAACREATENVSLQFPDQRFIIFDAVASYTERDLPNIASVTFRQNEASFLAGVLAAYVTGSDMEHANADNTVGIVLLRDNAVINDFLVGFIEGNHFVNEEISILSAYNNSAVDVANAKELTINMAIQGADVVFGVSSLATLGVVDGARERGIYAIGVDNDIAMQIMASDEDAARMVITSVLKNTDVAVFRAIEAMLDDMDNVKWGAEESLGFVENAVGLARNEFFYALSQEIRDKLDQVERDIISGTIQVGTAFGMTTEEVAALREAAAR